MNYLVWVLSARIILRGKDYGCGTFLWKETQKESFMPCLRNWSYLITSVFSSTLILGILIFHSDASQFLFCLIIFCIQQFHWLIILSNNLFRFRVDYFFNSFSSTSNRNYFVFSRCAFAKLKIFLSVEKNSEADSDLYCSKIKNRQFVWINLLVENLLNGKFYWPNIIMDLKPNR